MVRPQSEIFKQEIGCYVQIATLSSFQFDTAGLLVFCLRRRKRTKQSGLSLPFKKSRGGAPESASTSSTDSPTSGQPPTGPLKTDVVTYSTYRQQRLTDIRGSVGLAGDDYIALVFNDYAQTLVSADCNRANGVC